MTTSASNSATRKGAPIVLSIQDAPVSYQSSSSAGKAALEEGVDGVEAVGPADLLALVDAPRVVADRDFDDAAPREQEVGGELRLEVEADAAEPHAVERLAPEHLVGGLHGGEPREEPGVGHEGQEQVPEARAQREAGVGPQEARAVDDFGAALENRREQVAVLRRIELEVGVLNQQDVAGRVLQPDADRRSFPRVDRVVENADAAIAAPLAGGDRALRVVARSVVGDDDLLLDRADVDGAHALDDRADRLLLVVDGDDDGELHRYDAETCVTPRARARTAGRPRSTPRAARRCCSA